MYYITNQTKEIIAADKKLLALLGVKSIDELNKLVFGDITLSLLTENSMTITTEKITLPSMMGELTLIKLQISKEESASLDSNILGEEENNKSSSLLKTE